MQSQQPTGHTEDPLQLTGRLELRTFYANTKKSFIGVCLVTEKGAYLIRPADVTAGQQNPLQDLLGKNVTAKGQLKNEVFLVKEVIVND